MVLCVGMFLMSCSDDIKFKVEGDLIIVFMLLFGIDDKSLMYWLLRVLLNKCLELFNVNFNMWVMLYGFMLWFLRSWKYRVMIFLEGLVMMEVVLSLL